MSNSTAHPKPPPSEESAELLNAFLAYLSHEIRGPLGAMLGYTEMISSYCKSEQDRNSYLERIRRSGQSVLQRLNDVLDYSNAAVGNLNVEPIPFSLRQWKEQLVASFKDQLEAKQLSLEVRQSEMTSDEIYTDPSRLKQILTILFEEAMASGQKGKVILLIRENESSSRSRRMLTMELTATGVEWRDDLKDLLFLPLTKIDSKGSWKIEESRLKFATARGVAQALGGDVIVKQAEGLAGSTFVISLEVGERVSSHAVEACGTAEQSWNSSDLQGRHILLADDSIDCREPLRSLLSRYGASIDVVENGLEAVEKASKTSYDIILMDMKMPVVSGYKATRNLRQQGVQTPIVAISGQTSLEEQAAARESGCDAFLAKPFETRELVSVIRRFLPESHR